MAHELAWSEIAVRVGLACVTSGLLGLERESHGRAAGLRTTMLAGVAAAMAMILSQDLFLESQVANWRPDPARLAAGVLTGMGFLGGGAIIRQGNSVRGVTTAAVLWFTTIMGLAFGSGHFWVGGCGFTIALLALEGMPLLDRFIPTDWYGSVTVTVALKGASNEEIRRCIAESDIKIKRMDLDYDLKDGTRVLRCDIKFKKHDLQEKPEEIVHRLVECPGVVKVKWS